MSKIRSPNYPVLDLGAAIEAMRPVYKAEHRNKMSRETLAKHLGYSSLNGRALGKIGAVRAYGLIEGSADDLWVAEDTITSLMAPPDSQERSEALLRRAMHPALFQQIGIDEKGNLPSEANVRFQLVKKGFTSEAAGRAATTYLATMRLVDRPGTAYNPVEHDEVEKMEAAQPQVERGGFGATVRKIQEQNREREAEQRKDVELAQGNRREVITLDEGDVVITFPEDLSAESFGDLKDHLDLFVKKMQRRAVRSASEQ